MFLGGRRGCELGVGVHGEVAVRGLGTPGGVETMWTSSVQLGVRRWVERRVEGYKKCGRGKINHGRAFFLTGR